MSTPLIIGCGNPHRGDDAAGLLAARSLREAGLPAREYSGDLIALLDAWSPADSVILIDATQSGAAAGAITTWEVIGTPLPTCRYRYSTHSLSLADALELARALHRLPACLTIYGIEGTCFAPGAPPSPEVIGAAQSLVQFLTPISQNERA